MKAFTPHVARRDAGADELKAAWCKVLDVEQAVPEDNFFEIGGDSLAAVELVASIADSLGVELPMRAFLRRPTFGSLLELIEGTRTNGDANPLIEINPSGVDPPLFCFHAAAGTVARFIPLISGLDESRRAFGLQARGADSETLERYSSFGEMASDYEQAIMGAARPPYLLLGYSLGGLLAFELAQRLTTRGLSVPFVGLLDTRSQPSKRTSLVDRLDWFVRQGLQLDMDVAALAEVTDAAERAERIRGRAIAQGAIDESVSATRLASMAQMYEATTALVADYAPAAYDGPVVLFRASDPDGEPHDLGWRRVAPYLQVIDVTGDHFSMMRAPHVRSLSAALAQAIATAEVASRQAEIPPQKDPK